MKQLTAEEDEQLATTSMEELFTLDMLQPENIRDTLHAYQLAKHCDEKCAMYETLCCRNGNFEIMICNREEVQNEL